VQEQQRNVIAERVARNDATFREANEAIRDAAASMNLNEQRPLPLICECADPSCSEILHLTTAEYEAVRADPSRFINAPGHVRNDQGWSRLVAEFRFYSVVEKVGEAAEIVTELDPRSREES
jgi:hypothetical protein